MIIPWTILHLRAIAETVEDKSNIIKITTWATMGLFVLVFLVRQCTKFAMGRKADFDDLFILAATIFAIGLSVTVLILASDGLGVLGILTVRRATAIMKAYYASNFLYILTLGFAKLSLVSFFYRVLEHQRGQQRIVLSIGIFIAAWTLASLAGVAFQCGLPRPWEILTLHCFNTGVFWIVYCIIDMTSDVAIFMLSVNLVAYLKVRLSCKVAVVASFAPRLLVVVIALARLVFLYPISPHNDPEFNLWIPTIFTQGQVCLSIVTACIPYVCPIFEIAESGIRRRSQMGRKRVTIDEESYGCCSSGYFRGYRKAQGHSRDSIAVTNPVHGRTPDASPRIPSPSPLSPLEPPQVSHSLETSLNSSKSPNERRLRLHIPLQEKQVRGPTELASPQTASSYALSPACMSPFPLLSSTPLSPAQGGPPRSAFNNSRLDITDPSHTTSPRRTTPTPRFSLFPSQQPQYSPLPPPRTRLRLSIPPPLKKRPRFDSTTLVQPSPTVPQPVLSPPRPLFSPRPSSSLERVAYDDPLRTTAVAMTTSEAVPAPTPTPVRAAHDAQASIPPYHRRSSPTVHRSTVSSPQSVLSYYMSTPPSLQPRTFSPPRPHAYDTAPSPVVPSSPPSQRNQRILTPQNSSRRDQMSPVSPRSPLTFWREESSNNSAETRLPSGA